MNLQSWLKAQGVSVPDFALDFEVPLKMAQDWVYRGVEPSSREVSRLTEYISSHCAHRWRISVPNGPTSAGVCQRCGLHKHFLNSLPNSRWD